MFDCPKIGADTTFQRLALKGVLDRFPALGVRSVDGRAQALVLLGEGTAAARG